VIILFPGATEMVWPLLPLSRLIRLLDGWQDAASSTAAAVPSRRAGTQC